MGINSVVFSQKNIFLKKTIMPNAHKQRVYENVKKFIKILNK